MMRREEEFIDLVVLARRLTLGLLAEFWGVNSRSGRRKLEAWLDDMVRRRLLRKFDAHVKPVPEFDAPLYIGAPGSPMTERGAAELSWRLEERWATAPMPTAVYCAGPLVAAAFGGRDQQTLGNISALSHDVACAALLLKFLRKNPDLIRDWWPDHLRPAPGYQQKQPDVMLCDASGTPCRCIELGGAYPAGRLLDLDQFCGEVLRLPWEVW